VTSVLLDTNVLLRLVERSALEHNIVLSAIEKLSSRGTTLVLAPQVLVEFWVVATRPVDANGFGWDPPVVGKAIESLCQRFTVLAEGPDLFDRWRSLVEAKGVRGKNAHDARLAAIALVHGVAEILTLNASDFARFDGVSAVQPSAIA
jgi:predicted nucleic acid-binding protein